MKRSEFEHTIRAAARSIETDISALEDDDGSKADLIDGTKRHRLSQLAGPRRSERAGDAASPRLGERYHYI